MNMLIQDLAERIADKTREIAEQIAALRDVEFALAERTAHLLNGLDYAALGKNEKERELKLDERLRADEEWLRLHREQHKARRVLVVAEGELNALKAHRRGEEWYLQAMLSGMPTREVARPDAVRKAAPNNIKTFPGRATRPVDDDDDFGPDEIPF